MQVVTERTNIEPAIGRLPAGWLARANVLLARHFPARVYDAATIAFVTTFHRVIGAKFRYAQMGFDEHYFVWEGFSLDKGLVPYRDFQELKPPMIFLVNGLALKLFGLDGMGYRRLFALLSLAGFLSVTVALLSRGTSRWFLGAVMALMVNHFFDGGLHDSSIDNAESTGLVFFMIGCGILLIKTRWQRTQQVLGGAVLALVPLSKEPFALVTFAAWLALLLLRDYEASDRRAWRTYARFTIIGVASVVTTWLVFMLVTRSLGPYIGQIKMNLAYTKNYAYQLNWFPKDPAEGELSESWKRIRESYVNFNRIGVFIPLFAASIVLWRRRVLIGVAVMGAIAGSLYAVSVGHGFVPHYFVMAMTGTFFAATIGMIAVDAYCRRSRPLRAWISLSWVALAFLVLWPRYSEEKEKEKTYTSQPPPVNQSQVAYVRSHTSPKDKIFTLGEPLLYVYSDRLSAVHYPGTIDEVIQYFPGNTDEERLSPARRQLEEARPKLVIFGDDPVQGYARKQRYIHALVTPFLRDFHYKKIDEAIYERP